MYYVLCTMYFHPRRAQDRPKIAPREPKMVLLGSLGAIIVLSWIYLGYILGSLLFSLGAMIVLSWIYLGSSMGYHGDINL